MKYTLEVTVDAPLSEFIQKMDNADNMIHWQRGLIDHEFTEGEPGEIGSKMLLKYDDGKRKFELLETILKRDFPHEFHATYEMPGMYNEQRNYFTETTDGKTKWVSQSMFSSDKLLYRLMFMLAPFIFKKQSRLIMSDLKNFVENGTSVQDA